MDIKMISYYNKYRVKKARLPRKRKKQCIKYDGREAYLDTIKLHKIMKDKAEVLCKFWVESEVHNELTFKGGIPMALPSASKYW